MLKRKAIQLWALQVSSGIAETRAASLLGHEAKTLRRWRDLFGEEEHPALVPVVVKQAPEQVRSVRAGSAAIEGSSGHIAIQSPDGWSFAVESADDAVVLVRGLR